MLGYPYGSMFRLLILTGQRRSELAKARWLEFDLTKKLWTIPADRMKAAAAHVVPLSDDALTVLIRCRASTVVIIYFPPRSARNPPTRGSWAKALLDAEILRRLQKDHVRATLPDFVTHDLRRTVRTGLSAIPE